MNKKTSIILQGISISFLSLFFAVSGVFAANPQFNFMSNDMETLVVANWTLTGGTATWSDPVSASAGNRIAFDVYYHNGVEGTTANNTRIRIAYPTVASNQIITTGYILADNAAQISDTGTINLSSSQTISFENTAKWYPNQQVAVATNLNVTNGGSYVEVNIGDIAGGWPTQGHVVLYANVSTTPVIPGPNSPSVNAGSSVSVNEGQSVGLSATASDPQNDPMTYSWSCNGGSLSSSTILNPIYFAPTVSSSTVYSCTLTVSDDNGNSSSASVNINVINTDGSSSFSGSGDSSGGSPRINVSLSASPATGASPLNGVDLTASVSTEGISNQRLIVYRFDCEDNNSWELKVETTSRSYVAQDICNYAYDGTYTAKVKVESAGYESTNQITIIVGTIPGGGTYGISADAGPNKTIGENQSTILNGYGYSQYSSAVSYYWTCNGGSLSNSISSSPTFYAPSVNFDTTYSCILYVTDGRGFKNSDTVSILVKNTGLTSGTGLRVTTNTPESVSGTAATLKGTLDNDGGQYTSLRFNWGKLSSYNNFTSWVLNKTTGQTFSYYVSGLEKGKAYHYRVEASNGKEIVVGQDIGFITKPDATTGFSASAAGSGQISLSWNKAPSSCYTMVTRKAGSYPANSSDGTIVYYGIGNSVVDKNLSNNVWYYYRAWSVGCDEGLISYSESQYARTYTTGATGYVVPVQTVVESGISVETLARDITQNEIAWQNSITSAPSDEVEFKVIITPTGDKSLEEVVLKAVLSDKIGSIKDIKVNDESYSGTLSEAMNLGTIALGESKIVTFKGKIGGRDNFSYGSNELINTTEISAKNNEAVKKTVTIDVSRNPESEAGLISLINVNAYAGILTFLFIVLCIIVMYLLIERKKGKEQLTEKASSTKVEKSKYFNIK